jgi:ElaB/YqjD/DUF883 family membrane-anchored ribosome-binding protein
MDDTSRRVEEEARRADGRTDEIVGHRGDEPPATAIGSAEPQYRVEVIRAEIEQTREDLSETIDAIQDRLRPRNIVAGATERVKAATTEKVKDMANTAGDTAQDVMEQTRDMAGEVTRGVRDNPLPAVLIGIGTAWLLMNRSGARQPSRYRSGSRRSWDTDRGAAGDYRLGSREANDYGAYGVYGDLEDEGAATRFLDRVKQHPIPTALAGVGLAWLAFGNGDDRSNDSSTYEAGRRYRSPRSTRVAQDMRGTYRAAASGASEAAGEIAEQTHELASRAQEYVGDAADDVRWRARRAQNQLQRMLHENPLMVGAAAVVLGAAVGMALPETEREKEWMGDARDNLVDRAQDLAKNAASRVQDAAGEVAGEVASRAVTGKDE